MQFENDFLLLMTLNIGLLLAISWLGMLIFSSYISSNNKFELCDDTFILVTHTFKIRRPMRRYLIWRKRIIDNSDGEEPPLGSLFVI